MLYHRITDPNDAELWEQICALEGRSFATARSLPFIYHIKRNRNGEKLGEIVIDRRSKTITRATIVMAYQRALEVQAREDCVSGPKKLGVFGASYLYPIFLELGVCTKEAPVGSGSPH